jgi:endoglucanase
MKISGTAFLIFILFSSNFLSAQVFINQAGYKKDSPKIFYNSSAADSFFVIDSFSGNIHFSGELNLHKSNDAATGLNLYLGDFSGLNRDGHYFILTSGGDSSFNFEISDSVYKNVLNKSLKSFYFQRCGMLLSGDYAGEYYRQTCHTTDGFFHVSTNQSGFHQSSGGWHDAGDYGKYIVPAGITAGTLLLAYELFPLKFNNDELNIPESGNGIPDILDEIKYELDWFFKMQAGSGGVYFKMTKQQFESFVMPGSDTGTRYLYEISSTATGNFAAVMARASRIYEIFNPEFSTKCLNAAKLAWNFLETNPSIVPPGGFTNPSGTATGQYGDGNDSDERLWAAAELFETTGETKYHIYFQNNYSHNGILNSTMSWPNVKTLAQITYLTGKHSAAIQDTKNELKTGLINYCNSLIARSNNNGFGITINPGEYNWGCNSDILNKAILLILGYEQTKNTAYYHAALKQLDYILGTNAHNLSFVTGIGTKKVMKPHHRPSGADQIVEPIPGLLAGGPNQFLSDPILQSNFNSSTPPALCYIDHEGSYASNEIAINWNAPLVFTAGYFSPDEITSTDDGSSLSPYEFELQQNYPNPFNPKTLIKYSVGRNEFIILKVFDVLGKEVSTLVNDLKSPGVYEVEFDSTDLSSGVYIYELKAGENFFSKKMMVLK